jgi:hypothetical protein
MDVAGVVLSVVDLFPMCLNGFDLIGKFFTANKDVRDATTMIFIQRGVFISWGRTWEVENGEQEDSSFEKLLRFWPEVGHVVLTTLAVISDTFADVRQLENAYGIRVSTADRVRFLDEDKVFCFGTGSFAH